MTTDLTAAHRYSSLHRAAIEASTVAGCFHCCTRYPAATITEWWDNGQTAVCPRCGVDAVLGDASLPLDQPLLDQMYARWFVLIHLPPQRST